MYELERDGCELVGASDGVVRAGLEGFDVVLLLVLVLGSGEDGRLDSVADGLVDVRDSVGRELRVGVGVVAADRADAGVDDAGRDGAQVGVRVVGAGLVGVTDITAGGIGVDAGERGASSTAE